MWGCMDGWTRVGIQSVSLECVRTLDSLLLSVTIKLSSMGSPHSATLMLAPRTQRSELTVIFVLPASIYDASLGPMKTCPELGERTHPLCTLVTFQPFQQRSAWNSEAFPVQFCVPSQSYWSQLWFITANAPSASQGDSSLNMEEINNISHVCSGETKCGQFCCLFIWDSLCNMVKKC